MLFFVFIFLLLIFFVFGRCGAPIKVFSITWLICVSPITLGAIRYNNFSKEELLFELVLIGLFSCFTLGVIFHNAFRKKLVAQLPAPTLPERATVTSWTKFAWLCGISGTLFLSIDFFQRGGAGLNDMVQLRDSYVGNTQVSNFARISSVLTWGCLYSYSYALFYQGGLSKRNFYICLLPVIGYFLVALFSGGRQAAMQILLFTFLIFFAKKSIDLHRLKNIKIVDTSRKNIFFPLFICALMIIYMGYVAVARNDHSISLDKGEVLSRLFDFTLSPNFEWLLSQMPSGLQNSTIEALVYFTSPLPLFSRFLELDIVNATYGAMSLPFIMRQIEPITGISVLGALNDKIAMMASQGVIGVGWTTAISGYLQDFGFFWSCIFLFFQGLYTSWAWWQLRRGVSFHSFLIALILLTAVIYMPLISIFSETNILLLWSYCFVALYFGRNKMPIRKSNSLSVK